MGNNEYVQAIDILKECTVYRYTYIACLPRTPKLLRCWVSAITKQATWITAMPHISQHFGLILIDMCRLLARDLFNWKGIRLRRLQNRLRERTSLQITLLLCGIILGSLWLRKISHWWLIAVSKELCSQTLFVGTSM